MTGEPGIVLTKRGREFMLELERLGVIKRRPLWIRIVHWLRFGTPLW